MRVLVTLQHDRTIPGVAAIFSGPDNSTLIRSVRCLGKSDNAAAAAHGNSARDPLKPFGDLPCGVYRGVVSVPHQPSHSYGPYPVIVLNPVSGDCVTAQDNGRWGVLAHGGDLREEMGMGGKLTYVLRPTNGCCRFDNETMQFLTAGNTLGIGALSAVVGTEITFEVKELEKLPT